MGREKMLVENVAGVRRCAPEEVAILTGTGLLLVRGEGLRVKELDQCRALLVGDLRQWAFEA